MPVWMEVVIDYKRTRGGFLLLKDLNRDIECDDFMLMAGPVRPELIGTAIERYTPVTLIASNRYLISGDW